MINTRDIKATAVITDPELVLDKADEHGFSSIDDGAIYVISEEMGFTGENLIYCQYAMAFPYIRVQPKQRVWIRPTIISGDTMENEDRWQYYAFADAGGEKPTTDDQLLISLLNRFVGVVTKDDVELLKLGSKDASQFVIRGDEMKKQVQKNTDLLEAIVDAFKNWVPVATDGGLALQVLSKTFIPLPAADLDDVLSETVQVAD